MTANLGDLLNALGPGSLPAHLLSAIETVPRHHFVAEVYSDEAYKDAALPIGHGLTASRPSTIVTMLKALGTPRRALEIGTGCGWQAALLSRYAETYSIEINPALHERAARDLRGYDVKLRLGDGLSGWPEAAPFDGIIVCAALEAVPAILLGQLSDDGRLVAQIGGEICRADKVGRITPLGYRGRFTPARMACAD